MAHSVLDDFDLSGKTALVTGGGGLLGREFVRTLAQAGAAVCVADIKVQAAEEVAAAVEDRGGRAIPVEVDISDPTSARAMVEETTAAFERLDVLINNAAIDPKFDPEHQDEGSNAFESYPLRAWNAAVEVNLTGAFLASQAAVKPMLEQGSGAIINISSMYALVGPDQRLYQREGQPPRYKPVHYAVTKAGLLGMTRYLAAYYRGKNIRVNALSPGGVFQGHEKDFVDAYAARTILGRMAKRDELNGALLFLASDASRYMTGANLVVDGGWTAW